MWSLMAAPDEAVALLKGRLHQDLQADSKELARLIIDLGDEEFTVRQAAVRRLKGFGIRARGALRRGLAVSTDLERTQHIRRLLAGLENTPLPPELLRDLRAIQTLEKAGTPAAQAILERLARGGEHGPRTQAAREALSRLVAWRRPALAN
jgi:hypothetical protein